MRRVDLKAVAEVKKGLALDLKEQSPIVSLRRVVQELLPEIRAAMDRGYALNDIAKLINKKIPMNEGTLRGYIYGKDRVDRPKVTKLTSVKKKMSKK